MRKIIYSLLTTPPKEIPGKALKVIGKKISSIYNHNLNKYLQSYSANPFKNFDEIQTCFVMPETDNLQQNAKQIHALTENYLSHCFDLLGSGWVEVKHGTACRGLEGNFFPPQESFQVDNNGQWLNGRILLW